MILLLGGTTEAREFSGFLNDYNLDYIYSSATSLGSSLINNELTSSEKLSYDGLLNLVLEEKINYIFDLTHPYASEIKRNAIKVSNELKIPYISYRRPKIEVENKSILYFESISDIKEFLKKTNGNILLTTGTKDLDKWADFKKSRLYVRTLPTLESIKKCNEVGIIPKNIIAQFGPFSYEENFATCKRLNIKFLITKDSGREGGFLEKIKAASDLNIVAIILERPKLNISGIEFNNLKDLKEYAKKELT